MEVQNSDRVIVLVDMDCFYVQVEQKLNPGYEGKPCAVVQYKSWKGGGILALNYEAKAKGVTRFMRGNEAKEICPDIHLFETAEFRGKPVLTKYREAGALVLDVLCEYSECVEKASMDEAFLDLTSVINTRIQNAPPVTSEQLPNTFIVGWEGDNTESRKECEKWLQMIYEEEHLYHDRMLALAAVIVEEIRAAVYEKTGYMCSAGIAHNKMLAKLSCGLHKPNKQTVLPQSSTEFLLRTIPIKKVRNLGGKLGRSIRKKYNVENMGDLLDIPKSQFVEQFGKKTGHWLYNIIRGIDSEPVISRQLPKSIGTGKNFPGNLSLCTKDAVQHWLKQLSAELEERLLKDQNDNNRFAHVLTVSMRIKENSAYPLVSRSCPIHIYNAEKLAHDAFQTLNKLNTSSSDKQWKPNIYQLCLAASKFEDKPDNNHVNIESYFSNKGSTCVEDLNQSKNSPNNPFAFKDTEQSDNNTSLGLSNNSSLKSVKTEKSNKSISSFFMKKQLTETKVGDEDDGIIHFENEDEVDEKPDSILSSSVLYVDGDCVTSSKFSDIRSDKTSATDSSQISTSNEQKRTVGFFSEKLEEQPELNSVTESKASCSNEECENSEKDINKYFESHGVNQLENECTYNEKQDIYSVDKNTDFVNLDPELTKQCEQCNKRIPIWEESEHLDYHFALNLSEEISNTPSTNKNSFVSKSSLLNSNSITKSKVGYKRRSGSKASPHAKKTINNTKTLDAFFK